MLRLANAIFCVIMSICTEEIKSLNKAWNVPKMHTIITAHPFGNSSIIAHFPRISILLCIIQFCYLCFLSFHSLYLHHLPSPFYANTKSAFFIVMQCIESVWTEYKSTLYKHRIASLPLHILRKVRHCLWFFTFSVSIRW